MSDVISRKTGTRHVRLTPAQEALWLAEQMNPGTSLRHVCGAWELTGSVDLRSLRDALVEVVRRHPVMSASIEVVDGMPFQVITDRGEVPLQIVDCASGTDRETCDDAMRRTVSSVLHRAFDFRSGPLARVALVRRDDAHGILCVAAHHVIWDGLSTDVFAREMSSCYASMLGGTALEPAGTGTSFLDLAATAADGLSAAQETDLEWWKDNLTPLPDALVLPSGLTRAVGPVLAMAVSSVLDHELSARVRQASRAEHATPFMTMFAAFAALLFRLTGQKDMTVAVPASGRTGPDSERMIGLFVQTLPIRISVKPTVCFSELIRRVRGATLDAMAHQALPYPALVRELAPERHEATDPLCQVAFQLRRHVTGLLVLPGVRVDEYDVDAPASAYGLTMTIDDTGDLMTCSISFDPAAFDADMVQHLLRRYKLLLDTSTRVPGTRLEDLSILGEGEEDMMLDEWGGRRRSGSVPALTAHAVVRAYARARPDAVAVEEGDRALTYAELDAKADRLALVLRAHGVSCGTVVGLLMGRSTLTVVAMLATLKAGAVYMPMDPDYPPARLSTMVRVARPVLVLALEPHVDLAEGVPVMALDACLAEAMLPSSTEAEDAGSGPEDPAYVIFTSGSTGEPKGVVVPHRGILQLVSDHEYWDGDESDCVAHLSTVAFDAATFEVWGTLCRGARLVVIDRDTVLSPDLLALTLERHGVTTAFLTTSLFNMLVSEAPGLLGRLRVVLFGGEMADPAAVRILLESGPPSRLLHVYGPTETTTFALWYEVHDVPDAAVTVPVGRPLAGATAYVVDSAGQLAAPGTTGELYIGGAGVALGYVGDEQLTSQRFLPDPWTTVRGRCLYRTGDRAIWRSDGNLELKGRLDGQVKLRGFRIEPGEIVAALERQENVQRAVVIVREDRPGDRRLVSYVVSVDGQPLQSAVLAASLAESLPPFMLPSAYVQVESLPMTLAGKLDVRSLPAPGLPAQAGAPAEPSSEAERLLADVWRRVLGLESVGIDDDFFELGGHSLTAVRLVSEVERLMGIRIPMSTLFDAPTIRRLARLLSTDGWSPQWSCLVPVCST
ncbi:MAG TPA: amino acid adenylation domain-containing protein, partial [Clostridia bacterium]|nr:amino acid adenylation domain-containing protein [Clostridia bacterium]